MSKKEINKIEEPSEIYEVTQNNEATSDELHPVLIQLLEIGLKQIENGEVKTHDEVMADMKKKYKFNF